MRALTLGFLDVLTRFFNELAYTQVAMYGKTFTRASRDTWTLLVHHSGVDAIVQRELISTALALSSLLAGLVCSLICGVWARATLGPEQPHWWEAIVASFVIGFGSVSLVSVTVESGVMALFVCYAEDPSPLAIISEELYALFIQHPHVGAAAKEEPLEDYQPYEERYHEPTASHPTFPMPPAAPPPPPPPPAAPAAAGAAAAARRWRGRALLDAAARRFDGRRAGHLTFESRWARGPAHPRFGSGRHSAAAACAHRAVAASGRDRCAGRRGAIAYRKEGARNGRGTARAAVRALVWQALSADRTGSGALGGLRRGAAARRRARAELGARAVR